jgi:hypothetical protein
MTTKKPKTIVQEHSANFETLKKAFEAGAVCLMDCIEKSTGEHVAVICAMQPDGKEVTFVPFARFFNGNPYEMLTSPMEYDENVKQA